MARTQVTELKQGASVGKRLEWVNTVPWQCDWSLLLNQEPVRAFEVVLQELDSCLRVGQTDPQKEARKRMDPSMAIPDMLCVECKPDPALLGMPCVFKPCYPNK